MTSLAGYLQVVLQPTLICFDSKKAKLQSLPNHQDLVLASSWSVLWRGGQAWRTRIDGPALQVVFNKNSTQSLPSQQLNLKLPGCKGGRAGGVVGPEVGVLQRQVQLGGERGARPGEEGRHP